MGLIVLCCFCQRKKTLFTEIILSIEFFIPVQFVLQIPTIHIYSIIMTYVIKCEARVEL